MPTLPELLHNGLVVRDVEQSIRDFEERWGVERVADREILDLRITDAVWNGEPAETFSARYAFLNIGGTELELIEPSRGPSPYRTFLDEHGEGLHHMAFVVPDIDEHVDHVLATTPGASVLLDAPIGGGVRFVYVQGAAHGTAIELISHGN